MTRRQQNVDTTRGAHTPDLESPDNPTAAAYTSQAPGITSACVCACVACQRSGVRFRSPPPRPPPPRPALCKPPRKQQSTSPHLGMQEFGRYHEASGRVYKPGVGVELLCAGKQTYAARRCVGGEWDCERPTASCPRTTRQEPHTGRANGRARARVTRTSISLPLGLAVGSQRR